MPVENWVRPIKVEITAPDIKPMEKILIKRYKVLEFVVRLKILKIKSDTNINLINPKTNSVLLGEKINHKAISVVKNNR